MPFEYERDLARERVRLKNPRVGDFVIYRHRNGGEANGTVTEITKAFIKIERVIARYRRPAKVETDLFLRGRLIRVARKVED